MSMFDTLQTYMAAAAHGAAHVYHSAVMLERDITNWEEAHPEFAPLIEAAKQEAILLLSIVGVTPQTTVMLGSLIIAALKSMAARDPTVVSGGDRSSPQYSDSQAEKQSSFF